MSGYFQMIIDDVKSFAKRLIERILIVERDDYLTDNPETKGNGFYSRGLKTVIGQFDNIQIPRTRDGGFRAKHLPKAGYDEELEQLISLMFTAGLSTRKIDDILLAIYGTNISHATAARAAQVAKEEIEAWVNRPLSDHYAVIHLDCFFFPMKRRETANEAVYIALGVTEAGIREVLGYYIPGGGEGAGNWEEILYSLRSRGLQNPNLVIGDGLKGLGEAVLRVFPYANFQYCILHATKTCLQKVRTPHKEMLSYSMKQIYLSETVEEAEEQLNKFIQHWKPMYPKIVEFWTTRFSTLTAFLNYHPLIRKYLYTNNAIERLNKEVKRRINVMEQFASPDTAENILYLILTDRNRRAECRPLAYWKDNYRPNLKYKSHRDNKGSQEIADLIIEDNFPFRFMSSGPDFSSRKIGKLNKSELTEEKRVAIS